LKKTLTNVNITPVREFDSSIKVCELDFNGTKIKVAVCHGINSTSEFLDRLKKGDKVLQEIKFVEVMACQGGCII
jgi:iron only hydrogenase large subunit-like protein